MQEPLTASMLSTASPTEQKQIIGERLLLMVQEFQPTLAGKITGMLLENDNSELLRILENTKELHERVNEAVQVIGNNNTQTTVHENDSEDEKVDERKQARKKKEIIMEMAESECNKKVYILFPFFLLPILILLFSNIYSGLYLSSNIHIYTVVLLT